jgi:glycine C-acetyltransferase
VTSLNQHLAAEIDTIRREGLFKPERTLLSPQGPAVTVDAGQGRPAALINLCANNYLGLSNHPRIVAAAHAALDRWGFGLSSVRFICGTQDIHRELEARLARFLGQEDCILYASCFDANGGLFEALLGEQDAVISDALNHASIIDGIRLSKVRRLRYANNDMAELERQLAEARDCRFRLIATDGVFSMDGIVADLPAICDLAARHDALVMVDDSHAVGFLGPRGGGTPDLHGLRGRIDILTGTLGKALGGAAGGYVAASRPVVEWLRQRSRPYLFSNSLPPPIVAATIAALDLIEESDGLRRRLAAAAARFRGGLQQLGFRLVPGSHPIVPVLLGEARLAQEMAARLVERGVLVAGFSYPVVPRGQARIRTQLSAAHEAEQLDLALAAFAEVGRSLGVIPAVGGAA